MSKLMDLLHSLLSAPALYQLAMLALGSPNTRRVHISRYIRPQSGDRILDVGCGPADIIESLPPVSYCGIDINSSYIEAAKKNYGTRGTFICKDVTTIADDEFEPFDIVLATGLLHHLSDPEAITLLKACRKLLKPEGRMVTFDGCRIENQHPIDRWMLDNDRGKFVRNRDAYLRLAHTAFPCAKVNVHSDLLRIPYTLAIMELSTAGGPETFESQENQRNWPDKNCLALLERASES